MISWVSSALVLAPSGLVSTLVVLGSRTTSLLQSRSLDSVAQLGCKLILSKYLEDRQGEASSGEEILTDLSIEQ